MSNEVVAGTTDPSQYIFSVSEDAPATVGASGLAGAEVVDIEKKMGSNFVPSGSQLTATQPVLRVLGSGFYRLNKGATAGAVSLHFENRLNDDN
jgi:hypothetical protein